MDRPKSGFSIPLEYWMKNDMKEFINDNLSYKNIKSMELFNSSFVQNYKKIFLIIKIETQPLYGDYSNFKCGKKSGCKYLKHVCNFKR